MKFAKDTGRSMERPVREAVRSCCKTYCAWDNGVARRLKILMYPRVHSGFSPPRALFSRRSRRFSNNFLDRGGAGVDLQILQRRAVDHRQSFRTWC